MFSPRPGKALLPAPWAQLLSVAIGVVPLYLLAFLSGLEEFRQPTVADTLQMLFVNTLLFTALLVFLLYVVCGESFQNLQLKPATVLADLNHGVALCWVLLGAQLVFGLLLKLVIAPEIPPSNLMIARALAGDTSLMLLWLGPVVWLQAAWLEEFSRVFLLSRLWQVWPSRTARWSVLVIAAAAFGLGHLYQGLLGVAGTMLIGLVLGWSYLTHGRLLPLIVAHGLYNTVILLVLLACVGTESA